MSLRRRWQLVTMGLTYIQRNWVNAYGGYCALSYP